jgi:hypothetical protein
MHALHHPPSHDPPRQIRPNKYALRVFRHPLSIVLIVVIMVAVGSTAVLGGELYARHRATSALKKVVECVAEDRASVSFGAQPMLPQVMTGSFHDISVETAGNQFREAKGMKVYMHVTDLRLQRTGNSGGTVGSLDAQISWFDEGIKQTLQDTIRLFGGLMTAVTTKPSDGTIELHGGLGSITARPRVVDGGLALHVLDVTGFGFSLPPESVQPPLDALTSTLTNGLPTGIRVDTVQLTDIGITVGLSARHASIPVVRADPCFGGM